MTRRTTFAMAFALVLVGFVAAVALSAPLLSDYPASGVTAGMGESLAMRLEAPSRQHLLGTDELGRDVFTRTIHGARVSLGIGILSRFLAVAAGCVIGAAAGFYGGKVDFVLSRVIEIVLAFPSLILAIAIGVVLGPGLATVAIAIVVVSWVDVAVLIRALAAGIARKDYIAASIALGDRKIRILFREVIPNCLPTLLVSFSFGIASAIMVEASLSFLGLGISAGEESMPSWGWMISSAQGYLAIAPWAVFGPGIFLALTVLGWNMLGDELRDRFDVKGRMAE